MDAESFKEQFLPLHPRLYRVAYALLGNSRDAEDILQDAYCKLWSRRKELSHIRNTEAFCVTLVKNLCFDFLRAAERERNAALPDGNLAQAGESPSPESGAIERDELRLVQRLIGRLPPKQRQVLRLHGMEGCSPEEIEQLTGLAAVHIRVLLSRARKFIREEYLKTIHYERQRF
jgi:RNA polymerase sigma-70 factor (ECF subfamily)